MLILSCGSTNTKAAIEAENENEGPAEVINHARDVPSLKEACEPYFMIGNVVSHSVIGGSRQAILKRHFNILTAENEMKPIFLQPEKGSFYFYSADALVNAVLEDGFKVHGHTLAWHQQSPDWINREGISRAEAIENLRNYAKTVTEHFRGRVISWDVVNEGMSDGPPNPDNWKGSLRDTPWFTAIGPDYIEIAFRAAREGDPDAKLYYNDYNLDNRNKALAVYNMVKDINERNPNVNGRPLIDGIGMQGHYRLGTNVANVEQSLKRFISLGVEVGITELDVQAGTTPVLSRILAAEQGRVYARLFSLFRENAANISRVTIWGLYDAASWRRDSNPTLFDRELQAKPAFFAALDPAAFLAEQAFPTTVDTAINQADARYGTPSLNATDPLWRNAPEIPVNQYLMAWQGATGSARVLWDEQNLYLHITVNNAEMNKAGRTIYEQDSVEIFIDEGNHKSVNFFDDDGQYWINFDNERSFNPTSLATGFESRTSISGRTYTVTAKIPFRTIKPTANTLIGFDLQINGASAQGIRQSIAIWNDTSGNETSPSGFGVLRLVK
jgi:endo-1,4-beta-xylanase